jgi:hypothetical protein
MELVLALGVLGIGVAWLGLDSTLPRTGPPELDPSGLRWSVAETGAWRWRSCIGLLWLLALVPGGWTGTEFVASVLPDDGEGAWAESLDCPDPAPVGSDCEVAVAMLDRMRAEDRRIEAGFLVFLAVIGASALVPLVARRDVQSVEAGPGRLIVRARDAEWALVVANAAPNDLASAVDWLSHRAGTRDPGPAVVPDELAALRASGPRPPTPAGVVTDSTV